MDSEKGKELRKKRGNEVETIFGDQKLNRTKRRFVLRGLEKVNIEAGLSYIAHNLRKIYDFKLKKQLEIREKIKEADKLSKIVIKSGLNSSLGVTNSFNWSVKFISHNFFRQNCFAF